MGKTTKTECDGKWTPARKRSFIVSALRRASSRWSPKHSIIKEARIARNTYVCAECKKHVGHKQIKADHIEPVVPVSGFTTWDSFIERLFVEKDGFRAICKDCHKLKTKAENLQRKQNKNMQMEFAIIPKPDETR